MVTALTINYNTPDYLERLLTSFRKFYPDIPYLVIDGSDEENYKKIKTFDKKFNIQLVHFNYNIHHGPGMTYGIKLIKTKRILLVDSDMIICNGGWLELMKNDLLPTSYGIGDIQKEYYLKDRPITTPVAMSSITARRNIITARQNPRHNARTIQEKVWVDYLHPAFALINREVALRYPDPIKGGAPLIAAMKQISLEHNEKLLQRAQWLTDDLWLHKQQYVQHNGNHSGMGTVQRTGGYHL